MKKVILSGSVVAAFALYSWHARHEGANANVQTPVTLQTTPSPTATATPEATAGAGPTPAPDPGTPAPTPARAASGYRDGTFTGSVADAYYGNIQVQAVISGGRITDVIFLQHPNDRSTSREINSQAMPYLKQEAIQAQSAQVDGVSGATNSSQAFVESLGAALSKAKA